MFTDFIWWVNILLLFRDLLSVGKLSSTTTGKRFNNKYSKIQ